MLCEIQTMAAQNRCMSIHSSVAYIHVVEYSECFITDARMFWRSLWGSVVHVQAGISKQLVLTEGLFTDSRLQIAEFRIYILLHTFKWYRISAVTFFAKYVCKKKHGMFKSILNLLCLKTIHENTKVLVNRKVWACSIDFERRGLWVKKKVENHCFR